MENQRILLDNELRENIILDMVATFLNNDIDPEEAQEISAAAIETLRTAIGSEVA